MRSLGTFAAWRSLLTALGVYGVMAYAVAQRTGSMGSARPWAPIVARLLGLVLGEGLRLVSIGLPIGLSGPLPRAG